LFYFDILKTNEIIHRHYHSLGVFFGTSIIHGPAKAQVDHRVDQCPYELLVTFLLIQAERPARRGGGVGGEGLDF